MCFLDFIYTPLKWSFCALVVVCVLKDAPKIKWHHIGHYIPDVVGYMYDIAETLKQIKDPVMTLVTRRTIRISP
ncbi:MAG: hypothetical protein LE169_04365 [Endomicrobium sp.]|nr:hypothetical protein [Endomicrobium sp.]